MVDYVRLGNTALRLVQKNGRGVRLHKLSATAGDPSMPWKGPTEANKIIDTQVLSGVFVSPSAFLGLRAQDDDLLKRYEQFLIVAPGPSYTIDLSGYHLAQDDEPSSVLYRMEKVEKLRPGPLTMLYYFGLYR